MGASCPFQTDELLISTTSPVFSAAECTAVREEAAAELERLRTAEGAVSGAWPSYRAHMCGC